MFAPFIARFGSLPDLRPVPDLIHHILDFHHILLGKNDEYAFRMKLGIRHINELRRIYVTVPGQMVDELVYKMRLTSNVSGWPLPKARRICSIIVWTRLGPVLVLVVPVTKESAQREASVEDSLREGVLRWLDHAVRIFTEELEVFAEIEDEKLFLVLVRVEEIRAEPWTSSDHLPELRFRPYYLAKDEIEDLRHIDAGVEHVDVHGYSGLTVFDTKLIDKRLGVFHLVVDDTEELARLVRIKRVESLRDELLVPMVSGEDNGFPELVATSDSDARLHEELENSVHRVFVENPLIDLVRLDKLRKIFALFVVELLLVLALLILDELIVLYPLPGKLDGHREVVEWYKIPVVCSLRELVCGVCLVDRRFHCVAAGEGARPRRRAGKRLGFLCRVMELGPLVLQKAEVAATAHAA